MKDSTKHKNKATNCNNQETEFSHITCILVVAVVVKKEGPFGEKNIFVGEMLPHLVYIHCKICIY